MEVMEILNESYDNNQRILEIENEVSNLDDTIKDYEYLLSVVDAKKAWTTTAMAMVFSTAVMTEIANHVTLLNEKQLFTFFVGLSACSILYSYKRYHQDKTIIDNRKASIYNKPNIAELKKSDEINFSTYTDFVIKRYQLLKEKDQLCQIEKENNEKIKKLMI